MSRMTNVESEWSGQGRAAMALRLASSCEFPLGATRPPVLWSMFHGCGVSTNHEHF
jgi:hypothetical protein